MIVKGIQDVSEEALQEISKRSGLSRSRYTAKLTKILNIPNIPNIGKYLI